MSCGDEPGLTHGHADLTNMKSDLRVHLYVGRSPTWDVVSTITAERWILSCQRTPRGPFQCLTWDERNQQVTYHHTGYPSYNAKSSLWASQRSQSGRLNHFGRHGHREKSPKKLQEHRAPGDFSDHLIFLVAWFMSFVLYISRTSVLF